MVFAFIWFAMAVLFGFLTAFQLVMGSVVLAIANVLIALLYAILAGVTIGWYTGD